MSKRPDGLQAPPNNSQLGILHDDTYDEMAQHHRGSSNLPFPEDDLIACLQYPLDDSFEKGCCSDIFWHWPPLAVTGTTQDAGGDGVCKAESSGLASLSMRSAAKSSGSAQGSVRNGEGGSSPTSASADAALALGAGRAAGFFTQSGVEAFAKVRTSLQQPREPKLALGLAKSAVPLPALAPRHLLEKTPSSAMVSPMLPPRIGSFGSYGSNLSLLSPTAGKVRNFSNLSRLPRTLVAAESNVKKLQVPIAGGNSSTVSSLAESSTTALVADGLRKDSDANLHPRAQCCTGDMRSEQAVVVPGNSALDIGIKRMGSDSFALSRSSGTPVSSSEKGEAPEVVAGAYSGVSQTSEILKQAASSGKRKLDDSECQSEDVEGESTETKQSQARTSSSKRTRAAEIHNLSERRRRDRINERMKALQELIPNSNKTDKASMLDEAIEYLKMLQLQLQMMSMRSGVSLSPMVLPPGMPQIQMSQGMGMTVGPTGMGLGMGPSISLGMDMAYAVPARPPSSLPSLAAPVDHAPLLCSTTTVATSDSHSQASNVTESSPIYFSHPQLQVPSQSIQSVNMDMYNTYLQQQQQLQQRQLQLQLQQLQQQQQQHQQQQQPSQHPSHSK